MLECVVMRQASILQPRDFDRCSNKYSKGHGHPPAGRRGGTTSRLALARSALARAALATGVAGSLALLPLAWAQGSVTRRRVPRLPSAKPPHHGWVPGTGEAIRVLAIGESTVSGIGLSRSDETVAATTARSLARLTGRPAAWRACGLTGATVRVGLHELVPRIVPTPADLIIVAFCVNDVAAYRSPAVFADDLAALVTAARNCVGNAAVVVGGVAPLDSFPALPWPLRTILGWRAAALQAAAERLTERLPRLVVERFSEPLAPDLFASDGFHPNRKAHMLWGERLATLALPLIESQDDRR
jgi:lysophospholipase L1-like esterase